ncbi:MAG: hypothetical protein ACE5LU_04460 [Anaerolineae bacterium]
MDTVLAFSNSRRYAIRIPATVKRAALHALRQRRKPSASKKTIYLRLFTAGLYLLLRDHLDAIDHIIIDHGVSWPRSGHSRDAIALDSTH